VQVITCLEKPSTAALVDARGAAAADPDVAQFGRGTERQVFSIAVAAEGVRGR